MGLLPYMVQDFNGEIPYYSRKKNVGVNALSLKLASEPLRECCLQMEAFMHLLEMLQKVQKVTFLEKNVKCERLSSVIPTFDQEGDSTQYEQAYIPTQEVTSKHLH